MWHRWTYCLNLVAIRGQDEFCGKKLFEVSLLHWKCTKFPASFSSGSALLIYCMFGIVFMFFRLIPSLSIPYKSHLHSTVPWPSMFSHKIHNIFLLSSFFLQITIVCHLLGDTVDEDYLENNSERWKSWGEWRYHLWKICFFWMFKIWHWNIDSRSIAAIIVFSFLSPRLFPCHSFFFAC